MPLHGTEGMKRVITRSQVAVLVAHAATDRDRMLLRILSGTGCRIGEVVLVRCGDELDDLRAIRLRNLKRKRTPENPDGYGEKDVAIADALRAEIHAYARANGLKPGDWLFAGRAIGSHLTVRQARNIVYATAERAYIYAAHPEGTPRRIWPHVLRHTYATDLVQSGTNLKVVADQLGHAQIRNTALYTHVDVADRGRLIEQHGFPGEVPA